MDRRLEYFLRGLPKGYANLPQDVLYAIYTVLWNYAITHRKFGGDLPLEDWREREPDNPFTKLSWRDKWGKICQRAEKDGWLRDVGTTATTSSQSHSNDVTEWESLIFNTTDEGFELAK